MRDMQLPFWLAKKQQFCSWECRGMAQKQRTNEKYISICLKCAKSFRRDHASLGKFCSRICYWSSMRYGDKPNCIDCNIKISTYRSKRCSSCYKRWNVGENHPLWIADRTKLAKKQERGDSAYREWRMQVWLRDGFRCRISDSDCVDGLEVHHILGWSLYPELRYHINNGITLCRAHHPRKRAEEKRLIPVFQGLVSLSK